MVTFLLGGLWHGAGWTFVVWGAMHGAALCIHRAWRAAGMRLPAVAAWMITFLFINLTWVFFRAESISDAIYVVQSMFGMHGVVLPNFMKTVMAGIGMDGIEFGSFVNILKLINGDLTTPLWFAVILPVLFLAKNSNALLASFRLVYPMAVAAAFLSVVSVLKLGGYSEFLYFRF